MAHLRDFRHGDILKFPDGAIGIVSHLVRGIKPSTEHFEDGKYIYLFLDHHKRFYGDIAAGYFINFKDDEFIYIGNIEDIRTVI
jgi:hypothetical protein